MLLFVMYRYLLPILLAILGSIPALWADEGFEFFEREIRPVLVERCYDCHSGTKAKIGLRLDHRAGWLRGTDYHKVVDLEKPAESRVLLAVRHAGKVKPMPDKRSKLTEAEISALEKWISLALPWPENHEAPAKVDRTKHWSFQPIRKPLLPENVGHPIDYFVGRKLQKKRYPGCPAGRQVHFVSKT